MLIKGFTRERAYSCSLFSLIGVGALRELRERSCAGCFDSYVAYMVLAFRLKIVFCMVFGFRYMLYGSSGGAVFRNTGKSHATGKSGTKRSTPHQRPYEVLQMENASVIGIFYAGI